MAEREDLDDAPVGDLGLGPMMAFAGGPDMVGNDGPLGQEMAGTSSRWQLAAAKCYGRL
ncbi:hypothetical protein [Geobacter anodireducens]|nr:hypothetical protein [Geobacter soli]